MTSNKDSFNFQFRFRFNLTLYNTTWLKPWCDRKLSTINNHKKISFRLFQPYENNDISQIGSKKITDQVYKYSTRVSVHDDWIPPKTFFRQWLHPLFGEWTPYFVSTLSTIYIYIYTYIHTSTSSFYFVRNYLLFWTNGRIRGGHVHRRRIV